MTQMTCQLKHCGRVTLVFIMCSEEVAHKYIFFFLACMEAKMEIAFLLLMAKYMS